MDKKYHRKTAHHGTTSMTSITVSHLTGLGDMSKLYRVRISSSSSWQLHGQYAGLDFGSGSSASFDLTDSYDDTALPSRSAPVRPRSSFSDDVSIPGLRFIDFAVSLLVVLLARLLLPLDFDLLDVELDRDSERRRCADNVMLASAGCLVAPTDDTAVRISVRLIQHQTPGYSRFSGLRDAIAAMRGVTSAPTRS